jgi:hypothetical protein
MGPGHGGGPAAPGGRLYGGGGLQLSVPLPVSTCLTNVNISISAASI